MTKQIRLGIIGCGNIANRFMAEAAHVPGISIPAVYHPGRMEGQQFQEEWQIPHAYAYDEWEAFLEEIDAVYIASPHETHAAYARQALGNGVHVLCEKPMALSAAEAKDLYLLAKENACVLMEAVKTACCPGFLELEKLLNSGVIGEIRDVETCFTRLDPPNSRVRKDRAYGGSFLEFGSYTLFPVFRFLGCDPGEVRFDSIWDANGIDLYTRVTLRYKDSLALAKNGIGVKSEGQMVIAGTKGYLLVAAPWWKTTHFEVRYEDPDKKDIYEYPYEGDGLRYELTAFRDRINGGGAGGISEEESVALADMMEQFMKKRNR